MKKLIPALCVCAALALPATADVMLGQVDDFEDGTVMGWFEGAPSPNPPTNIPSGGPDGADDNYLENAAAGGGGAGSRMIMFNTDQWTGDFLAAGVTSVSAQMANLGQTTLYARIAIEGAGTQFGSTDAFMLPADGMWYDVEFELSDTALSLISGAGSLNDVLGGVTEFRILSAETAPAWRGDRVAGTLGTDNITAVPEPASLALLGLSALLLRRRG